MHIVWSLWIILSIAGLAGNSLPVLASTISPSPTTAPSDLSQGKILPEDYKRGPEFHTVDFVFEPSPTPEASPNPKFHRGSFRVQDPSTDRTVASVTGSGGEPTATPAPIGSPQQGSTPAPVDTPVPTATPTPTPTPPSSSGWLDANTQPAAFAAGATATPTALAGVEQPTSQPISHSVSRPVSESMQQAEEHTALKNESFRYGAPEATPAIDDPRFYRGSFSFDETGTLNQESEAGRVQSTASSASTKESDDPGTGAAVSKPGGQGGSTFASLQPTYYDVSPLPVEGRAMYYNPGIMAEVLHYRLNLDQVEPCSECIGYVALLRAGDLNRRVWLQWGDGTVDGPYLVIDVAARHHVSQLLARQWVVDVDHNTALRRKMNRPVPVTVLSSPPGE